MNRHRLDPISLVMGVSFVVIGLTYLAGAGGSARPGAVWPLPVGIIVIGASIIASLVRGRGRGSEPDEG